MFGVQSARLPIPANFTEFAGHHLGSVGRHFQMSIWITDACPNDIIAVHGDKRVGFTLRGAIKYVTSSISRPGHYDVIDVY